MRPAAIYCALFIWNAITGGRFMAPYLQIEHHISESSLVGIIIAVQFLISSLLSGWGGRIADKMESKYPLVGRILILSCGIAIGTSVFLIESTGKDSNYLDCRYTSSADDIQNQVVAVENDLDQIKCAFIWHLCWRITYALSVALTAPVLDGLTLAHLKREATECNTTCEMEQYKYGRERLHGAIWYGIGNVLIGICLDHVGFDILYTLSILSTLVCYIVILMYYRDVTPSAVFGNKLEHNVTLLNDADNDKSPCGEVGHHNNEVDDLEKSNRYKSIVDTVEDPTEKTQKLTSISNPTTASLVSFWSLLSLLVSSTYNTSFFISYFLLNIGLAVVENLIFLFYQSILGSSYTMCGVSVLFTVALEIPIFYCAPYILHLLGPGWMLILACVAFILRMVGYMNVPHMGLLVFALDLFHGITYACSQSASVAFISEIMPDSYEASGQGILLLVRGMGGTIGLVLGGLAHDRIGARALYAALGLLVSTGTAFLGSVLLWWKQ